jgi:NAD(P)-dependent dehydrogenase (short-subunit alcohol dehydrogenase family)
MTNMIETTTFGANTTTDDVLSGVSLKGKRILVTGVSAGIGVETARSLAAHGAQVVGAARDANKAKAATVQVQKDAAASGGSFELAELDLANLKSVRACADGLLAKGDAFDVVIANAGVMATPLGTPPMASKRSSARITWDTLSWSTGLQHSFGREGA